MLTPFMSCSAKIPIYAVFAAAFFSGYSWLVMFGLYFGGIAVGVLAALVLDKTAFRGKPVPFVLELPNYRFPSMKCVLLLMWGKAKDFLQRAFTIIFIATIVIWFLQTFDTRLNLVDSSSASMLGAIGQFIAPIFAPLGFGDWRASTALISGLIAKESVISTLGVLLESPSGLTAALPALFTPVTAISFLVFTLLYTPCIAAIGAVKRESGGLFAGMVVIFQCILAWAVSFLVYNFCILFI